MTLVVDTGVLYAAADTRDGDHQASRDLFETHAANDLVVPGPVITEAAWLISTRLGAAAETAFVASVAAGELRAAELTSADYRRCSELLAADEDLTLGLVDASVVAIAERLGLTTIATLNHRDFRVVRPTHVESFELVPLRSGR